MSKFGPTMRHSSLSTTRKVTFPEKFFLGSCDELRKEHQGLVTIQLFTKFKRGLNSLPSDVFWW